MLTCNIVRRAVQRVWDSLVLRYGYNGNEKHLFCFCTWVIGMSYDNSDLGPFLTGYNEWRVRCVQTTT